MSNSTVIIAKVSIHVKFLYIFIEKNPFTQKRSTASQNIEDGTKNDNAENSESDDFDEFYNDKSFMNTGGLGSTGPPHMHQQQYTGPNFGGANFDDKNQLNRVSYKNF